MQELWKDIDGYNGLYQVSSKGRVRSWKTMGVKVARANKPRLLKTYLHRDGYEMIALRNGVKENKHNRVHRLMAKAFIPNPDNKKFINHKNGVKDDNRLENLEWCTRSENMQHASKHNLLNSWCGKGYEIGTSKLNEDKVREIKRLLKTDLVAREIAEMFGVCRSTIKEINRGATWSHVQAN